VIRDVQDRCEKDQKGTMKKMALGVMGLLNPFNFNA
jgi:hypothetical protein